MWGDPVLAMGVTPLYRYRGYDSMYLIANPVSSWSPRGSLLESFRSKKESTSSLIAEVSSHPTTKKILLSILRRRLLRSILVGLTKDRRCDKGGPRRRVTTSVQTTAS
jgi:hypothetical protein